jgi:multidrug transporter EmrE-like cation transporter
MLQLGTLLALACALTTNLALLCKHRGAAAAPSVELRRPLRSAAALFRSRWWTIGFAIATGAWILHVAALTVAPLSVVETTISGGLVVLAWLASRWFGAQVGVREWLGLALCAAGLGLLAATSGHAGDPGSGYSTAAMIPFEATAVGIGLLLLLSSGSDTSRGFAGALLGVAAGLLLGVANVSVKALTGTVPGDPLSIVSPWSVVALTAGVVAFFALARGMQRSAAIPVITLTTVAANVIAIMGGVLVFGDPVGADPLAVVARCGAFVAVIVAAALMPSGLREAPTRA